MLVSLIIWEKEVLVQVDWRYGLAGLLRLGHEVKFGLNFILVYKACETFAVLAPLDQLCEVREVLQPQA